MAARGLRKWSALELLNSWLEEELRVSGSASGELLNPKCNVPTWRGF